MPPIESDLIALLAGKLPQTLPTTPLIRASANGHLNHLETIARSASLKEINHTDPLIGNALTWAAHGGHEACLALLLEQGAWPNITSALQGSPLYQAVRQGHTQCVALLMRAGADPEQTLPRKLIPHYEYGHLLCLKSHSKRSTALMLAKERADLDIQRYINLDPDASLPDLSLPIESMNLEQLNRWIHRWIDNPKQYEPMLTIRIAHMRNPLLLEALTAKFNAVTFLSDFFAWGSAHQESKTYVLMEIDRRIHHLKRIQACPIRYQLAYID